MHAENDNASYEVCHPDSTERVFIFGESFWSALNNEQRVFFLFLIEFTNSDNEQDLLRYCGMDDSGLKKAILECKLPPLLQVHVELERRECEKLLEKYGHQNFPLP